LNMALLRVHCWPWLGSLGLHGLLIAALLGGNGSGGEGAPPPIYQVSLTPGILLAPPAPLPPAAVYAPSAAGPGRPAAPAALRPAGPAGAAASVAAGPGPAADLPEQPPGGPKFGPYEQHQLEQAPKPIFYLPPAYPQSARRRGVEGWVEVKFLVNRSGAVSHERVLNAQPGGIFENAALNALRRWRFAPGRRRGLEVDSWVVQKIHFRIT
jgi:protein TonB